FFSVVSPASFRALCAGAPSAARKPLLDFFAASHTGQVGQSELLRNSCPWGQVRRVLDRVIRRYFRSGHSEVLMKPQIAPLLPAVRLVTARSGLPSPFMSRELSAPPGTGTSMLSGSAKVPSPLPG